MSEKKPLATLTPVHVTCLRCGSKFITPDKTRKRICRPCSLRRL